MRAEHLAAHLIGLSRRGRPQVVVLSLFALAGPLLGVFAYERAARFEQQQAQTRFGEQLNERARLLEQEMHSLAEELYRLRSLFAVEDAVSRGGFRVFTERALAVRPELLAFEWAPRVPDGERGVHERAAGRDGAAGYRILAAGRRGTLVPAPANSEYFPVLFAEPRATNARAIGFDLSSEPTRRAALAAARETETLAVSAPIDLVQAAQPAKALLLVLPVFGSPTTGHGASPEMDGFLLLVVSVPELLARALTPAAGRPAWLDYVLVDELTGGGKTVIAASPGWPTSPPGKVTWVRGIEIGGRRWALGGRPTALFISERRSREPVALGLAGFLVWEALGALLFVVSGARARRSAEDERRNWASESLRQGETVRRLSSAVEQTADSVFITNREGIIEYVNPAFEATTGYSREEALGKTPRILKSGQYDRAHYEDLWRTILAGQVSRSVGVNRKKSGELYHAEQTITPMKDAQGRTTHFVSVIKDVTDRMERHAREIEMEYAARVQRSLYPQRAPRIEGLDVAGAVFPAVKVGGDYFDFLQVPGCGLLVAIGDVCGHGLASALIMAETRAYLRSLAESCADPCVIVSRLNPLLYEDLQDERPYVTLLLARVDVAAGQLTYASAGHTPGYVLDRHGAVSAVLESTGPPLGMFAGATYAGSVVVDLRAGDLFVLLTDGITEAESPDGSAFEADRALEVIRAHREEPARAIVQHLRDAVLAFADGVPARDDLTVVIGRIER